jgi:hypothetical protein
MADELDKLIQDNLKGELRECPDKKCLDVKFALHRKNKYHSIYEYNHITQKDIKDKKEFTEQFLEMVDNFGPTTTNLAIVVRQYFNKDAQLMNALVYAEFPTNNPNIPDSKFFVPSKNSLYFIFLANLYCNYKDYAEKYIWLDGFLSICDQENLTGIFAIDKHLYKNIFNGCKNTPDGYEILNGYFLLSNSSISLKHPFIESELIHDFLDEPSPLETNTIKIPKTASERAEIARHEAARQSQYSVPMMAPTIHAAKTAKTVRDKTVCKHGATCNSKLRTATGNRYGPDVEHMEKYIHGGRKRRTQKIRTQKRRTQKRRKNHKRRKTIKRK